MEFRFILNWHFVFWTQTTSETHVMIIKVLKWKRKLMHNICLALLYFPKTDEYIPAPHYQHMRSLSRWSRRALQGSPHRIYLLTCTNGGAFLHSLPPFCFFMSHCFDDGSFVVSGYLSRDTARAFSVNARENNFPCLFERVYVNIQCDTSLLVGKKQNQRWRLP